MHGDLHERIVALSEQIESDPDSSYLYLKRGELYFQHEVYDSSIIDFKKCEELGDFPKSRLYYSYAKSLNILEEDEMALSYLKKILDHDPNNVNTIRFTGKILAEQGRPCESISYLENVISFASKTMPINYLEVSQAYLDCNDNNAYKMSSQTLESGISELGPLMTFYNELVRISILYQEYEHAVEYQTAIIDLSNRKEFALLKRAELYYLMEQQPLALSDIKTSHKAIEELPERIKRNQSILKLKDKITNLTVKLGEIK